MYTTQSEFDSKNKFNYESNNSFLLIFISLLLVFIGSYSSYVFAQYESNIDSSQNVKSLPMTELSKYNDEEISNFFVIASNSMSPTLQKDDIILFSKSTKFSSLQLGDIIIFNRPDGADRKIVHRIIDITDKFGEKIIVTKADSNDGIIPGTDFPIREKDYIGKVIVVFKNNLTNPGSEEDESNSFNADSDEAEKIMVKLLQPVTANASAIGEDKSKIAIVEFGDYQCSFCKSFNKETKNSLVTNFVKTGKIKFIFKDFIVNDLPGDKASTLAAEASYCAAEQGKYWDYHDELYRNSNGENTGWVTKDNLKQFANNVNVPDRRKFSDCVDSNKYNHLVSENDKLARSIGLTSTPSFILYNGTTPVAIQGAYPYSIFEQVINEMN